MAIVLTAVAGGSPSLLAPLVNPDAYVELAGPATAVALCSCLVAADSEKVKRPPPLHADLKQPLATLQEHARTLARTLSECRIETDEAEYISRFDSGLMNVTFAWCNGSSFDEVTGMVDLFEGSIIRVIRRISELLDELKSAAVAIGSDELYAKFGEGAALIRRDIVFAASLYIEG